MGFGVYIVIQSHGAVEGGRVFVAQCSCLLHQVRHFNAVLHTRLFTSCWFSFVAQFTSAVARAVMIE